jgi:hypothetical protein
MKGMIKMVANVATLHYDGQYCGRSSIVAEVLLIFEVLITQSINAPQLPFEGVEETPFSEADRLLHSRKNFQPIPASRARSETSRRRDTQQHDSNKG